jgi:gliding motility-associated-like protein
VAFILSNDSILYVPDSSFVGNDTLWYSVCDDGVPSLCDSAMVVITVVNNIQPPIAVDDSATTQSGTPVTIGVLGNDTTFTPVTVSFCNLPANGTVVINANGSITYTPNTGYVGFDTLCYIICDDNTPQSCDTALVYITVLPPNDLFVPNLFTPNGDGDNDFFEIPGIENYPNASVLIFNRWGNEVYNRAPYQNEWNGNNNNGEPLPAATYYYILDLGDGVTTPLNGFVIIHR